MDATHPNYAMIKQRQQQIWATGDFSRVAMPMTLVGELLNESVRFHPGATVLDVACGSGNTTLAAARRLGVVSGLDYVPALLERGRERAAAEGLSITFVEGDAEALPFDDASFQVVLSSFGVMFAPNQEQAAAELLRVCQSGGTIGLANWTPTGLVGDIFRISASYMPPPPGLKPPSRWGTEAGLQELLGDGVSEIEITRRNYLFRGLTPEHWLEIFLEFFGPARTTHAALESPHKEAFAADLLALMKRGNQATDGTLIAPGEYLEVIATRR